MTFWELIALFAGFTALWAALEWLAHRFSRRPDDPSRVQSLLDDEQAAHDAFRRAAGRIGRMPE